MSPEAATRPRVKEVLRNHLALEIEDPDLDLIDTGLIDSLTLVRLISRIEREFGFAVNLETLDIDDFRSVSSLTAYVASQLVRIA